MVNDNQNPEWTPITFTEPNQSAGVMGRGDYLHLEIAVKNGAVRVKLTTADGSTRTPNETNPSISWEISDYVSFEIINNNANGNTNLLYRLKH